VLSGTKRGDTNSSSAGSDASIPVGQHLVESCRELSGLMADEEPEPGDVFTELYEEVAGMPG